MSSKRTNHHFTDEHKSFIITNAKGITRKELTSLFNNHFNLQLKPQQISCFMDRNRLHVGYIKKTSLLNKPLKENERDFAEMNYDIMLNYLDYNRLNYDYWYDIVAIAYIVAVKKWFLNPNLHVYKFSTIAQNKMKSAVGNERKRLKAEQKYITCFLLDDLIKNSENLCYSNLIVDPVNDFDKIELKDDLHEHFKKLPQPQRKKAYKKLQEYLKRA